MAEHVAEYIDDDYTMENNSKSCLKRTKKMKRIKTETPYTDNLYKLTSNDFEDATNNANEMLMIEMVEESTSYQHIAYTDVEELVDEPVDELVDEPVDEPVDKPTNTLIDDIDAGSQLIGDATVLVEVSRQAEDDRHGHRIQERETRKGGAHQRIRYRPELLKFVGSYGSRVFMKNEFPIGHAGEGTANARLELGNDSLQGQCAVIRCGKQNQH
ncbi:uncharacterized protein LOC134205109 isoform X6 [Armigeres subalbatus]|uniref:uncharacterized protein LOC134205109 isoform X6 n=1 Tax=Armigeres subalbatus TaxID=124917 RepID=UPI002ED230D3